MERLLHIKILHLSLLLGFQQNWNLNREISKINYKIHTDATKTYLLGDLTKEQLSYKYASEADMLNVALFNKRAKEWGEENPKLKVNI